MHAPQQHLATGAMLVLAIHHQSAAWVQETFDYLKSVCGDLHVVKGEFDEPNSYPEEEVGPST